MVLLSGQPAAAETFKVLGKNLDLFGYLSQAVNYSVRGDHYDTEEGFNSLVFNAFAESRYTLSDNLTMFTSGQITYDWIYQAKTDDNSWNYKLFRKSKNKLYVDDHYWQLLKEAHVTWTPEHFFFRAGKQIVAWGEMLGFRLLDQINPWDQRRGFADVEFDSTIIPIWLLRSEFYFPCLPSFIQDLGVEFTLNPNADFIPDQLIRTGNDKGGIWAPDITFPNPLPPFINPAKTARVGAGFLDIKELDQWNLNNWEYALRLKGLIHGAYVTLNYFYGYDNDPVTIDAPPPPGLPVIPTASDGTAILPGNLTGYYGLLRFVGGSVAYEIERLRVDALGGIAPMWRIEAAYFFDTTFGTMSEVNPAFQQSFEKHDEFRYAISADWKIWVKWLNPRYSFSISPTFYHRIVRDYPHTDINGTPYDLKFSTGQNVEHDNYVYTLMVGTKYFHEKIVPQVFWLRDQTNQADMIRLQLSYIPTDRWSYTVGTFLLDGREGNKGFDVFENKDYVWFKVSFKWG